MRKPFFLIAMMVVSLVSAEEDKYQKEHREWFPKYADAISKSTELPIVYEGLPHQVAEHELMEREKKTKKTVTIYEHLFYETPLKTTKEEAEQLRKLMCDPKGFKLGEGKLCGGFHPDYCIEWQSGEKKIQLLICLGCEERMSYGLKEEIFSDISEESSEPIAEALKKYKRLRPSK